MLVIGDYVAQPYFLGDYRKEWQKFWEVKKVSDLDLDKWYHFIYDKKTQIRVVIMKNTEIADQIRDWTIKQFK